MSVNGQELDPARLRAALHVTNGDCTAVADTGLADRVLVWFDVLHEGPVPATSDEELRRVRAAFLADVIGGPGRQAVLDRFVERDTALAANRDGEYVLWFEADLYDQLQIVQILARLLELQVPADRITLICVGEYPGIARFGGLGQLRADQLRDVASTHASAPLTAGALALAARAWDAFRAPDPSGLAAIAESRSGELRFLGEAFDRLGREYPSTRDGLSLTERRILAAVDDARSAADVFGRAAGREARPFLGDTWAFAAMDRFVQAREPLLATAPPALPVDANSLLRLTKLGASVLAGAVDHAAVNGLDRWVGGVHLQGDRPRWRFDEGTETVEPARRP